MTHTMTNETEMIQDAMDILEFYSGDEYECLADESVVSTLMDDYGVSIQDAHAVLFKASALMR